MREWTSASRRKRSCPVILHCAPGILARVGLVAEIVDHRIDISLQGDFARANRVLHASPFSFVAQPLELFVRIKNKRWPWKTAGRARTVRVHADDIKSL